MEFARDLNIYAITIPFRCSKFLSFRNNKP